LEECLRDRLRLRDDIALLGFSGKCSLGLITVSLSLSVLLEGILDRDLLTQNILAVQRIDSSITALKVGKANKTETLARARLLPRDLWQTQQWTKPAERVVEDLLVDHGIEVSDEQLGANFGGSLFVCAGFVNAQ
jgi:hypothetical protein